MEWFIVLIFPAALMGDEVPSVGHSTYGSFQSKEACETALIAATDQDAVLHTTSLGYLVRGNDVGSGDLLHAQCLSSKPIN